MICPNCGHDNLPGSNECNSCQQDLTQLDRPVATNKVERSLMEDPVSMFCRQKVISVQPDAKLSQAIKTMLDEGVGSLMVVDQEANLVGILSERDLLVKVAGKVPSYDEVTVDQFMTSTPETITAENTLAFALHKMAVGGYRHLPVLEKGKPQGVVSVRDMLRHITKLCKDS